MAYTGTAAGLRDADRTEVFTCQCCETAVDLLRVKQRTVIS